MFRIIGGDLKGRRLRRPSGPIRPTSAKVREALFDLLQAQVADATVLDAFAGSGAVGFEALSRGCRHVTFVERDRRGLSALRANVAELGVDERSKVLAVSFQEAVRLLHGDRARFDLVFLDPPYAEPPDPLVATCFESDLVVDLLTIEVSSRVEVQPPTGISLTRKRYGDTALVLCRRDPAARP